MKKVLLVALVVVVGCCGGARRLALEAEPCEKHLMEIGI